MVRFRIAIEPMQNDGSSVTLFAKTSEWERFMEHMRENNQSVLADILENDIDKSLPVNRIRLSKAHAQRILRIAGLVL